MTFDDFAITIMGLGFQIAIKVRTQSGSVLSNAICVLSRCLALLVWGLVLPFEVLATALASWGTLGQPVAQRLGVHGFGRGDIGRADLLHAHPKDAELQSCQAIALAQHFQNLIQVSLVPR